MKSIEVQAPNNLKLKKGFKTIFLAGSIEMGKAIEWQQKLIDAVPEEPYIWYNPRRDDWDDSWTQEITNPQFKQQVEWELKALEQADYIVMYFDPKTKSPISLLELGLHAKEHKLIVLCPEGFWKKGNVDVVCKKYDIRQVKDFDELIEIFKNADF